MRPVEASWILFALLALSALSGCLGQGGPPGQGEGDGDDGDLQQDEGEEHRGNETDGPGGDGGNTTDDGDGDPGDGNETQEEDGGDEGDEDDGNEKMTYEPGWPEVSVASIRPGVKIGGVCTANFIFSSPDNRTLYIGTASHCVSGSSIGDPVQIAGLSGAGTLAYCSWMYTEDEDYCPGEEDDFLLHEIDFALVEIDGVHRNSVHPSMLYWGGPTTLGPAPGLTQKVYMYGNSGTKPNEDLRVIEGYVARSSTDSTGIYSFPPGIPGDSGSPVVTSTGEAVGVFVAIGITGGLPGEGVVSNLENALDFMEEKAGIEVELKTWDLEGSATLPEI